MNIDHFMYYYKVDDFVLFLERLHSKGTDCSKKMTDSKFFKYIPKLQEWNVKFAKLTENNKIL